MNIHVGQKVETKSGKYLGRVIHFDWDDISDLVQKLYVERRVLKFFAVKKYVIARSQILKITNKKIVVEDAVINEKHRLLFESDVLPMRGSAGANYQP